MIFCLVIELTLDSESAISALMAKLDPGFCEKLAGLIDADVEHEVEKRCREWLARTKGIDFADLLIRTASERDQARRELEEERRRAANLQGDVNDLKESLMETAGNLATAMVEIQSMRDLIRGVASGSGHTGECARGCQCSIAIMREARRVVPFKSP